MGEDGKEAKGASKEEIDSKEEQVDDYKKRFGVLESK